MTNEELKQAIEELNDTKAEQRMTDEEFAALADAYGKEETEQETQAYREAAQLAKWLFKTHYAQEEAYVSGRVIWGLCDTTAGVISQIDNMVCKLVLLKEPEQEPVESCNGMPAYEGPLSKTQRKQLTQELNAPLTLNGVALYPQPEWVGLTVDELIDLERKHRSHESLTRAIEAKLKEKNT